jgi:hypothetical protein
VVLIFDFLLNIVYHPFEYLEEMAIGRLHVFLTFYFSSAM